MENNIKCPKCNNEMEEGITKGSLGALVHSSPIRWGKKDSISFWTGKVKGGKDITAYKCKSCGYLESYAN